VRHCEILFRIFALALHSSCLVMRLYLNFRVHVHRVVCPFLYLAFLFSWFVGQLYVWVVHLMEGACVFSFHVRVRSTRLAAFRFQRYISIMKPGS